MEDPPKDLYWNSYDRELLKRTAACKGFPSVIHHMRYLLKNDPVYCGQLYEEFKTEECEANSDEIYCKNLKKRLVTDCDASCSGNSVSVDNAILSGPKEAGGQKLMAELRGMTEVDYIRMVRAEEKSRKYWWQRMLR